MNGWKRNRTKSNRVNGMKSSRFKRKLMGNRRHHKTKAEWYTRSLEDPKWYARPLENPKWYARSWETGLSSEGGGEGSQRGEEGGKVRDNFIFLESLAL